MKIFVIVTCVFGVIFSQLLGPSFVDDKIILRYRNCSGCVPGCYREVCYQGTCEDYSERPRDYIFQVGACFREGDVYYKGEKYKEGIVERIRMYACGADSTCASCTEMDPATPSNIPTCHNLFNVNTFRIGYCNKMYMSCIPDHDSRPWWIYSRPTSIDTNLPEDGDLYNSDEELILVDDGNPDCSRVFFHHILSAKVYRRYWNMPSAWTDLQWYDLDNFRCDSTLNRKPICVNGRLKFQTFTESNCAGEVDSEVSAEEVYYGAGATCDHNQRKFVCGPGPFTTQLSVGEHFLLFWPYYTGGAFGIVLFGGLLIGAVVVIILLSFFVAKAEHKRRTMKMEGKLDFGGTQE